MTAPEEIVPGVYGIAIGPLVNAFVVVNDDTTLIDTGTVRGAKRIEAGLAEIGRRTVSHIALTHHHPDHRGGAAALRGQAPVYVHELDADVVRGDREPPGPSVRGGQRVLIAVLGPLVRMMNGNPPDVPVAKTLSDGDELPGGLRAIHTPGHTAGHTSFLLGSQKLLFVGDAAQNRKGLNLPVPFFTEDMEQAKRTLSKIAELDFDVAVFGHGEVLKGRANAEFRRLVDKLAASA